VEKTRRRRYAASTTAEAPRPVGVMTAAEAAAELLDVNDAGLRTQARPWVVPPAPGVLEARATKGRLSLR
jgi:hypothetical protein